MEGSHCCSGDIMSLALAGGCGAREGVEGEDPVGAFILFRCIQIF